MSALKVFISYAREDEEKVLTLCQALKNAGYDVWLDKDKLVPGQDWELEIAKAIRATDFLVACFSQKSVVKTGYIQKELRKALAVLDEQPEGKIYLIPVRLDECELPSKFAGLQRCDLFDGAGAAGVLKALEQGTKERALAGLFAEVLEGPDKGREFKVFSTLITIGRAEDSHIRLSDPKVSFLHAKVEVRKARVVFQHVSQGNYSIIQSDKGAIKLDAAAGTAPLGDGDLLTVGKSRLRISLRNLECAPEVSPTDLS